MKYRGKWAENKNKNNKEERSETRLENVRDETVHCHRAGVCVAQPREVACWETVPAWQTDGHVTWDRGTVMLPGTGPGARDALCCRARGRALRIPGQIW